MNEKQATQKLTELLPTYYAWLIELDRVEEADPSERTKPFPPASEGDIAETEKRLQFTFPPSYRAFLKMHNGWAHFSFDWSVFGVSGPGGERVWKEWTRESGSFGKKCLKKGEDYVEKLRAKSEIDAMTMYWPDHVPCAADFNGGFRVFDRNRQAQNGEFEIAEVGGDEESVNRLPDFIAFVERCMKIARRELANHGIDPDGIAAVDPASISPAPAKSPQKAPKPSKSKKPHGSR